MLTERQFVNNKSSAGFGVQEDASRPPQSRLKKSRKALIIVTLRILLYFWDAGKIVLKKTSNSTSLVRGIRRSTINGAVEKRGSRLPFRISSTWKLLWGETLQGKLGKQDWKLMMKLKQIYKNMYDKFAVCAPHLPLMNVWRGGLKSVVEKRSHVLSENGKRREGGGGWRKSRALVRSCLQMFKSLRSQHRNVTWGEIVHSHDDRYQTIIKKYNTRLQLYRKMPLKRMSRLWGQFNQWELPVWLRIPAIRLYIWLFNCCLEEAEVQDLREYHNVGQFFQRRLRPGVRPIESHPLTSPCDGTILHCDLVTDNTLEQVKGVTYSLKGFLGPKGHLSSLELPLESWEWSRLEAEVDYSQCLLTSRENCLFQCIIYLAPGDYHRFHSPADWTINSRRHFPGELFSVNPSIARWLQGLFNFNERVVYDGRWSHGYMSMTLVGATNVGSITIYHDEELLTNVEQTWPSGCFYDKDFTEGGRLKGVRMTKGEAFGHFSLGSTIVLLFEAPPRFRFQIKPGQKLKYGQGIGSCDRKVTRKHKPKVRTSRVC